MILKKEIKKFWLKERPIEELMECQCGAVWPIPAKFCGYCGKPLSPATKEK
jgi:hypothetical protein